MSCIIFRYRRFYAIICKITHFFYPKRKNPPLFAHSALHKASTRQKVCPAPRYQHAQRPHLRQRRRQ